MLGNDPVVLNILQLPVEETIQFLPIMVQLLEIVIQLAQALHMV